MNQQPSKQKKILIILAAISAVVVPLMIILSLGGGLTKVTVTVHVSPKDAAITIDGKPAKTGKVSLTKGKHTIEARRDHFAPTKGTIDTEALDDTKSFYLVMAPNDDEGRAYLESRPDEQLLREVASGSDFSQVQQAVLDRYSFVTELPHETLDYKIDYQTENDKTITLLITLYPAAVRPGTASYDRQVEKLKAEANKYLAEKDVDTSKVKVTYTVESGNSEPNQ